MYESYPNPAGGHEVYLLTVRSCSDISIDSGLACSKEFSKSGESDVWLSASKALRWLHCLVRTSESPERALRFFSNCAHRLAPDLAFNLENISVATRSSPVSCDRRSSGSDDDSKFNEAIPLGDIKFINIRHLT